MYICSEDNDFIFNISEMDYSCFKKERIPYDPWEDEEYNSHRGCRYKIIVMSKGRYELILDYKNDEETASKVLRDIKESIKSNVQVLDIKGKFDWTIRDGQ